MTTRVDTSDVFKKDLKKLARKYPSVLDQVENLIAELEADERAGDKIPNVGYDVYKVRLKNSSASRGKRGGFRVIYYVRLVDEVFLLTVYSKSQQSDISLEQIRRIIADLLPPKTEITDNDHLAP
jgi:mRNA-degrading endonuclease RelE of RelBE toxin-antitoxin system